MKTNSNPTIGALNTKKAAEFIGVSESYLRKSRMKNSNVSGPKYKKVGSKVIYKIGHLHEYIDQLPTQTTCSR